MAAKSLRKQRELEQRRLEVLEVALDLFSRKGFEQTSMAETGVIHSERCRFRLNQVARRVRWRLEV